MMHLMGAGGRSGARAATETTAGSGVNTHATTLEGVLAWGYGGAGVGWRLRRCQGRHGETQTPDPRS